MGPRVHQLLSFWAALSISLAGEADAAEGASKTVRIEAMDAVVFGGEGGACIREIWQWRGPTPLERREELDPDA